MSRFQWAAVSVTLALSGCIENYFEPFQPPNRMSDPPPIAETTYRDEIVQVLTPKVDILWTIDNSCSMSDEQDKLAKNFPLFMDYFLGSGLDYHVGVTSTDIDGSYNGSRGKLVDVDGLNFIDQDTPSPIEIFIQMASLGTTGSGSEKGLGATYLAIEDNRDTFNEGFYREEASLHTIVISDEPDYTPSSLITEGEFTDWYDGLKDDVDNRSFNCIIDPQRGGIYASAARTIGGLVFDTNQDWPPLLDQLGVQAAGFKREYFLSHLPISDTIVVSVRDMNGVVFDGFEDAWTYDDGRNSITFLEYIPEALATVIIEYTLAAAESDEE
jgi:hypothetical protein